MHTWRRRSGARATSRRPLALHATPHIKLVLLRLDFSTRLSMMTCSHSGMTAAMGLQAGTLVLSEGRSVAHPHCLEARSPLSSRTNSVRSRHPVWSNLACEEDCRKNLVDHLTGSGKHESSALLVDMKSVAATTSIVTGFEKVWDGGDEDTFSCFHCHCQGSGLTAEIIFAPVVTPRSKCALSRTCLRALACNMDPFKCSESF